MILLAALIAIAFFIMFYKTKLGMYFRAIISDRSMVECLGINVPLLNSVMFAISIALGELQAPSIRPFPGSPLKRAWPFSATSCPF